MFVSRWWFQPIWKICSSNWIISPCIFFFRFARLLVTLSRVDIHLIYFIHTQSIQGGSQGPCAPCRGANKQIFELPPSSGFPILAQLFIAFLSSCVKFSQKLKGLNSCNYSDSRTAILQVQCGAGLISWGRPLNLWIGDVYYKYIIYILIYTIWFS